MKKAQRTLTVVLVLLWAINCPALEGRELYGKQGITPSAVRQGGLGSCHFHASIAALASVRPELLRASIDDSETNIKVRFADGSVETVYPQDMQFARENYYEMSDGLWVAAVFRAYAQRSLREALTEAVDSGGFSPLVKNLAGMVLTSDLVLLAYDRAIRAEIDQAGHIDRARLKTRLRGELQPLPVQDAWKERVLDLLDSGGYFKALEEKIEESGELFGAYSSVGQGGMPERVLHAFTGSGHSWTIKSAEQVAAQIGGALQNRQAAVAWTREAMPQLPRSKRVSFEGSADEEWFSPTHAYTVLGINTVARTITLRNPWGNQPEPDGVFTLPLDVFAAAYEGMSIAVSTPTRSRPNQNRTRKK